MAESALANKRLLGGGLENLEKHIGFFFTFCQIVTFKKRMHVRTHVRTHAYARAYACVRTCVCTTQRVLSV